MTSPRSQPPVGRQRQGPLRVRTSAGSPPKVLIVLAVCSLTLVLAVLMKDCPPFLASHPLTSLLDVFCFTDLTWLYRVRSLDLGVFPYTDGYIEGGAPAGGAIEYPVLTGLFMWLVGTVYPMLKATSGFQFYSSSHPVFLPRSS
jgi:hypothetical protein